MTTPKNLRRFTFLSNNEDKKNLSLPKTASTLNEQNQPSLLSPPILIDKKQISKELLSQIHFCRFVYKLLQRIDTTIDGSIGNDLRTSMNGILLEKLYSVENLTCLEQNKGNEYKKTSDYQKVCQIVTQYLEKYQKEISTEKQKWIGYQTFETEIVSEIRSMYRQIQS